MSLYKFITDEGWSRGKGCGTARGFTYVYSVYKGGDYKISVSLKGDLIATHAVIEDKSRVNLCDPEPGLFLALEALCALVDISQEIQARLAEAKGEYLSLKDQSKNE